MNDKIGSEVKKWGPDTNGDLDSISKEDLLKVIKLIDDYVDSYEGIGISWFLTGAPVEDRELVDRVLELAGVE